VKKKTGMSGSQHEGFAIPAQQQVICDKCFHPSETLVELVNEGD
jgi:hypothetical protein